MPLWFRPKCPYCQRKLGSSPRDGATCPHCGHSIVRRGDKLFTKEQASVEEWLTHVIPLGATRDDFDAHRRYLSQKAGRQAPVNDVCWRVLSSLADKHAGDPAKLYFVYLEMAELAASEWKDPSQYLEQAAQYSPDGRAILHRHPDPEKEMSAQIDQAAGLEKVGWIDQAISLYEFAVAHGYPRPRPYERLRILYDRRGAYQEAIRACRAFLALPTREKYAKHARQFEEWIPKLEQKLENQREK